MNIYHQLNTMITYIESHLDSDICYLELAKILGVNEYTMQRLFSLLCNISLSDYIRKRKLSQAGYDLYHSNETVTTIAFRYGYENATSFSRAFEKFHGIKPSQIKKGKYALKNFPKIVFEEKEYHQNDMTYEITELEEMKLYGKGIPTNETKIKKDAPAFWESMNTKYNEKYGSIEYGMVVYEDRFNSENFEYWVLWGHEIEEFDPIIIPKSKWLIFHISSTNPKEIQKVSDDFYCHFFPSSKYNLRNIPELEYYHDEVTDFLVPIE